jgi:hypothetical protein
MRPAGSVGQVSNLPVQSRPPTCSHPPTCSPRCRPKTSNFPRFSLLLTCSLRPRAMAIADMPTRSASEEPRPQRSSVGTRTKRQRGSTPARPAHSTSKARTFLQRRGPFHVVPSWPLPVPAHVQTVPAKLRRMLAELATKLRRSCAPPRLVVSPPPSTPNLQGHPPSSKSICTPVAGDPSPRTPSSPLSRANRDFDNCKSQNPNGILKIRSRFWHSFQIRCAYLYNVSKESRGNSFPGSAWERTAVGQPFEAGRGWTNRKPR